MENKFKIYEPYVTIWDKDSRYTACAGERCELDSISIKDKKSFAVLINSQNNKLNVPYEIFKDIFKPSKNQTSPL